MATQVQLEIAIGWLLCNEGDGGELNACRTVAKLLRQQLLQIQVTEAMRTLVRETGKSRTVIKGHPAYAKMVKALAKDCYPNL